MAADKGFFEREGLQARLVTMRTALITPALMQGDLDYTAALPSISGPALNGLPVKFVGVVSNGTGYAIVSKPEIENVQGLKGKKFGINSFGASDDYTVYTFLSKNGLDPARDVTLLTHRWNCRPLRRARGRSGRCGGCFQSFRVQSRAERA